MNASPRRSRAAKRAAGVQSFEVGLALLSLLAHQRRPMKITALAAAARMPPAKAHRYLASLVRSGYASQNPDTGLYSTGPAALDFSLSCLSTIEPIEIATAEAVELVPQDQPHGGLVGLGLLRSDGGALGAAAAAGDGEHRTRFGVPADGVRHRARLRRLLRRSRHPAAPASAKRRWRPATGSHCPALTAKHLQESIEQVRRRGIARARGDFMSGLSAFAAPILDHRDRLVLAMTVLDYSRDWDHRIDGTTARALLQSVGRVSASLGRE